MKLFELKFKEKVSTSTSDELKWQINNIFVDKYFSGKNKWFFKKLDF